MSGPLDPTRGRVGWVSNPVTTRRDLVVVEVPAGATIRELLELHQPGYVRPFVALVNGQPVLQDQWNDPLPAGATVHFMQLALAGGGGSNGLQILASIAVIAASLLIPYAFSLTGIAATLVSSATLMGGTLLVNLMFARKGGSAATTDLGLDTKALASLNAGGNRVRLGEPWVEHFGRVLFYPDLIQKAYTSIYWATQDQYFYAIYEIGVGAYDIQGVYIDETPLTDYTEAQYNIVPPGGTPSLVPQIVYTSDEVSGQELQSDAYLTAIVNPAGTAINEIEFDIVFPAGLGQYLSNGMFFSAACNVEVTVRQIDDNEHVVHDWALLWAWPYYLAWKEPLRWSYRLPAPWGPGRYEVRFRRGMEELMQTDAIDSVIVGGLRGFGWMHPTYGDVTLLEVKIKATDQMSPNVVDKINVIATRKLRTVGPTGFGDVVATRNPIDAIAYMVTSMNGGGQPEEFLDWEGLYELRQLMEEKGHCYDFRHASTTSVMDAVEQAALLCRAVPYLPSGKFSLVRDEWHDVPAFSYSDDDYTRDSLNVVNNLRRTSRDATCVTCKYVNPVTWEEESVTYLDEFGSEDRPKEITLAGCTNRQHAYELAKYFYLDDRLNRTTVEFVTGLMGLIPQLGQRIQLASTRPSQGQCGLVADLDGTNIYLSEPVDFAGETSGNLYVTLADGTSSGPHVVTATESPHCVQGSLPAEVRTQAEYHTQASKYSLETETRKLLDIRVLGVLPEERNSIRIVGNIVHEEVFEPAGDAPPVGQLYGAIPPLTSVNLRYVDAVSGGGYSLAASWAGGATTFRVQLYINGILSNTWDYYTGYTLDVVAAGLPVTLQVTPYVDGVISPADALSTSYDAIPAPSNLRLASQDSDRITVAWDALSGISTYQVGLYVDGALVVGTVTPEITYTVTTAQLQQLGGPWPEMVVKVAAVSGSTANPAAALTVSWPSMEAPQNLHLVDILAGGVVVSWDAVPGAVEYVVYRGSTPGFDPAASGMLAWVGGATTATIGAAMNPPYAHYFVVAARDAVFDTVGELTFSAELMVASIHATADAAEVVVGETVSGNSLVNDWGGSAALSVVAVNGDPAGVGSAVAGSSGGVFVLQPNGDWVFDPGTDFNWLASNQSAETFVEYTVSDGRFSQVGMVTVTVGGVNFDAFAVTAWGNAGLAESMPTNLRAVWVDCAVLSSSSTAAYGVAVQADGTMQLWGDVPAGLAGWESLTDVARAWVRGAGMLYITTSGELKKHGTLSSYITNNWPTITDAVMLWWPRSIGGEQMTNVLVQRTDGTLFGFGQVLGNYSPPAGMAYPLKSISLGGTNTYPVAATVDATDKLWVWGINNLTPNLVTAAPTVSDAVAVCIEENSTQGPGMVQHADGSWSFWGVGASSSYWASFRAIPSGFYPEQMQTLGPAESSSTAYAAYSGGMGRNTDGLLKVWGGASLLANLTPPEDPMLVEQMSGFAHSAASKMYGMVALLRDGASNVLMASSGDVVRTSAGEDILYRS
ncbi:host specificity factor TipJ family phage tail protein [Megalodesulfovibrio paquesii]